MIRIGLLGATGRMGHWVTELVHKEYSTKAEIASKPKEGESLLPLLESDVVIDFSSPPAVLELARAALTARKNLPAFVIGSTGWKPEQRSVLEELALHAQLLQSSNFSTGVMALQEILKIAAPLLQKLGYTPVIIETHHQHKKDAPSGTAISLQRIIAPETPELVQTHSVRAGEVIGEHEIQFHGPVDRLVLGHFAQERSIFARGAIEVALWLGDRKKKGIHPKGLLSMDDFLKEKFYV